MLNRYKGGEAGRAKRIAGPRRRRALTLVELLVVVVVIAFGTALLLPSFARYHDGPSYAACQSNLKQIGIAFRTWEGDYGDKYPMSISTNKGGSMEFGADSGMFMHFQVMSNELVDPRVLICPADNRKPAANFAHLNNNHVSYFVGLDTDETRPAMLLSGDRKLVTNGVDVVAGLVVIRTNDIAGWSPRIHESLGNICFADASVQRTTTANLQTFLSNTGTNVNRLAVP